LGIVRANDLGWERGLAALYTAAGAGETTAGEQEADQRAALERRRGGPYGRRPKRGSASDCSAGPHEQSGDRVSAHGSAADECVLGGGTQVVCLLVEKHRALSSR
jgi:hypothetical protein